MQKVGKNTSIFRYKWLSVEAIQIAEKRREDKDKWENERYTHLNAEFQRIARRDKKAFLSNQCKVIEENRRMRKTRDLFKKIRDTKGTFYARMGSIKDRNSMDLIETEDIKKICTKKIFMTNIIMMVWSQPRARHPGMQSQESLRKHHYEQS